MAAAERVGVTAEPGAWQTGSSRHVVGSVRVRVVLAGEWQWQRGLT
jgi:hypothetical protein